MIIEKPQPPLGEAGDEGYEFSLLCMHKTCWQAEVSLQQKRRSLKTPE